MRFQAWISCSIVSICIRRFEYDGFTKSNDELIDVFYTTIHVYER